MFEEVIEKIREQVLNGLRSGAIREYSPQSFKSWARGRDVVTRGDLAYELGKQNSALLILWGSAENRIYLSKESDGSLAVIVICDVVWDGLEKYECFRALRDAFYNLSLYGVTIRSLPSQLKVWLRVARRASEEGFSLGVLARAVNEAMNSLEFVRATDVIILTSRNEMDALKDAFLRAKRIIDALIKMHEEKLLNCEECDYRDVCSEIPELKMIRDRIKKQ
ncbi:MAG: hypothetical protein NOM71_03490 [Archaeoglobi archaeon]|nr:hypothetical protein [Archaeoglobi archaeon]